MNDHERRYTDQSNGDRAIAEIIEGGIATGAFSDQTPGAMLYIAQQLKKIKARAKRYQEKAGQPPRTRPRRKQSVAPVLEYDGGIDGDHKRRGRA